MKRQFELIKEAALRLRLDEAYEDDDISITAEGMPHGWILRVKIESAVRYLATARGEVRKFANLETVALLVSNLGYQTFKVDTENFQVGRLRGPRPDRAAAMKKARG